MTECPGCATQLPPEARFCLTCGRPVAAVCHGCGADLVPEAAFCMTCGTPRATVPDGAGPTVIGPRPTGASSRRTTSILFADLVGFTTLSETRDTEDMRELLGRYFDECRQIITRYGGTIEKFIGDAVMAVWGVPTAHEDDAERAVRAGLELVAAVADFGHDVGAPELALRVGIVTGEVAVTVGATQQGMVAGDPVNTAARVQSAALPGQVWVDETTRLLTAAAITYADVGSHQLKGKVDPVPLWSVRAVVAAVGGAQRADGLEAPLVGRDRELRLVKELFHQSEESRRPVLLVVDGEPGVGKTRLGWEFEKYVDGLNDPVRWHSGRGVAYGEGVAYFALAEAVRGRLQAVEDQDAGGDATDLTALLSKALARYVPDDGERSWVGERLAALLGLASVGGFPREDLFSAWVTFLERVGEGHPVTLVIDDAQHADEGLLAFLEYLLTVASFACYVVLLTRPGLLEARASLATHRQANIIRLPTLQDRDVAALLDGLVAGLPESVRDQLVARSDGVPVFAVETIRSLIDRDLVVPRGGQYVLADPDSLDLDSLGAPATLQALIAARLDALGSEQRLLVDRASVLGQTFTPEALVALCPEVGDPGRVLAELVRLQIFAQETSRISADFGNYRFMQSAVRQVAYGVLSRRDRRAIHLAVVAHFETSGETGDDTAAMRAQHYLEAVAAAPGEDDAELVAAALDNLVRAARRATSLSSFDEAARHLTAAVPLTDGDPERRDEIVLQLARAELDSDQLESATRHAGEARERLVERGDRVAAGMAAAVEAWGHYRANRESAVPARLATPWWEELRDREDAVDTVLELGQVLLLTRIWAKRDPHEVLEPTLVLAEAHGRTKVLAHCYTAMGLHYANLGAVDVAGLMLRASADKARAIHDLHSQGLTLTNLTAQEGPRDLAAAAAYGASALEISLRSGSLFATGFAVANDLLALWSAGEWDEMDAVVASAVDVFPAIEADVSVVTLLAWRALARDETVPVDESQHPSEVEDSISLAWVKAGRAALLHQRGDRAGALSLAAEAIQTVHETTGVWDDFTHLWPHVVDLAFEVDDHALLTRLLGLADDAGLTAPRGLQGHASLLRARLAVSDHRAEEVEASFTEAIGHYETWGSAPAVAHARRHLGGWLLGQGRDVEGQAHLADARATYERLGAAAWLAELDSAQAVASSS